MDALPQDVLRELLMCFSKPELLVMTLVCQSWHWEAQELIDKVLDLECTIKLQDANLSVLERLAASPPLQARVSTVQIAEWHIDGPLRMKGNWMFADDPFTRGGYFSPEFLGSRPTKIRSAPLQRALCKALTKARPSCFIWTAASQVPRAIMSTLSTLSGCEVRIYRHNQAVKTTTWSYEAIIHITQAKRLEWVARHLSVLELTLPPGDTTLLCTLGEHIAACPMLTHLSLYAMGRLWTMQSTPNTLKGGLHHKFRSVDAMDWLSSALRQAGRKLNLKSLELDSFCVCQDSTFDLDDIVDVTHLQHVACSCFAMCRNLHPGCQPSSYRLQYCRHNRREVANYCRSAWEAVELRNFLSQRRNLRHLTILDGESDLDATTMRHLGPNLLSLTYRDNTLRFEPDRRSDIIPLQEQTDEMLRHCIQLRHLSIFAHSDVAYLEWLQETLVRLVPDLRTLELYCPAETEEVRVPGGPISKKTTTVHQMPELWKRIAKNMHHLQSLQITFAELNSWDRDVWAAGLSPQALESHTRTLLIQKTVSRDLGGISLASRCAELEEARKAVAHSWAESKPGQWKLREARLDTLAYEEVELMIDVSHIDECRMQSSR